jgi:hypothetical protein
MLAELRLQDRRQQLGPGASARDHMERCGGLMDGLASSAGEALAHGLDHLELPRHDLQRLGHVLAQLGQLALAAGAGGGTWHDDPLARQLGRERRADRPAADAVRPGRVSGRRGRSGGPVVLGGGGLGLLQLQLELVQQLAATLGRRAEPVVPHLGDHQLEVRNDGFGARRPLFGSTPCRLLGQQRRAEGYDVVGQRSRGGRHTGIQAHTRPRRVLRNAALAAVSGISPPPADARYAAGSASRCRPACSRAGRPKWTPRPAPAWAR